MDITSVTSHSFLRSSYCMKLEVSCILAVSDSVPANSECLSEHHSGSSNFSVNSFTLNYCTTSLFSLHLILLLSKVELGKCAAATEMIWNIKVVHTWLIEVDRSHRFIFLTFSLQTHYAPVGHTSQQLCWYGSLTSSLHQLLIWLFWCLLYIIKFNT